MSVEMFEEGGPSGPPSSHSESQVGLTFVELLAFLFVLVVAAAILVPSFFGSRDLASDAQSKADARSAEAAALDLAARNGGRFDGPNGLTLGGIVHEDPGLGDAELAILIRHPHTFTLRVTSASGNVFDLTRNPHGSDELSCSRAGSAGCPEDGTW